MKTRLTNNHLDFVKHIEGELAKPFSPDSIIVFSVFPSLGSGHFSVQVIVGDYPFLLVRQWDQDLAESYQLGIFNLDTIKINEERVNLSDIELKTIQELASVDMKIEELKGLILDGVDFKLSISRQGNTKAYHWRTEEQISIETKGLIKKLVDVAGL